MADPQKTWNSIVEQARQMPAPEAPSISPELARTLARQATEGATALTMIRRREGLVWKTAIAAVLIMALTLAWTWDQLFDTSTVVMDKFVIVELPQ